MKKTIKIAMQIILIATIILSICPHSYAKLNPTLPDIVDIFNNCSKVIKYNQDNSTINLVATNEEENVMKVRVRENEEVTYLTYTLITEGATRILTGKYTSGNTRVREYWEIVTPIIIDCIGQFHGYAEGEMMDTLNATQIANYTLSKDGLEINDNAATLYWAQIDINKVISIIDTNTYIKPEDLDDHKINLKSDGIVKYKKGKVVFYKQTIDDKDIIIVGEQSGFSYIIDRSIASILNVMFENAEVANYYNKNYPKVSVSKEFKGFKIEVNPIRSSTEDYVLSTDDSYKYVRITIDRAAIKDALAGNTDEDKEVKVPEDDKKTDDNKEKQEDKKEENKDEEKNDSTDEEKQTDDTTKKQAVSEPEVTKTTTTVTTTSSTGSAETTGVLPKTGPSETKTGIVVLYFILVAALMGIMGIGMSYKKQKKEKNN